MASVVPSSLMASGGVAASAPNSHLMRLIIPILEVSCLSRYSGQRSRYEYTV